MHKHVSVFPLSLALTALLAGTLAHGQSAQGTITGESGELFGAKVTTWAKLAADGAVQEVGVTIPVSLFEKAPAAPKGATAMGGPPPGYKPFALDFPEVVKKTTFLDHVDLGWVPTGHPPVYMVPHFDLHFFTVDKKAVEAIDCHDLTTPDPSSLPAGYVPPVPPNTKPDDVCVTLMGFHTLPVADVAPGAQFDKTMLAVYYGGKLDAIEPMITQATFLKKQSFTLPVPVLPAVGKATLFPTAFAATFDKAANAYNLVFSGFNPATR